ncbi:MAG: ABC transporter ATP-binding protein, partial [Thermoanaerobaculia bacterium]
PTRGEVAVDGQVASLLELGMGFHFDFTGRQNISINAAIMGLSPQEVERRGPEIIAFSELGEFIDRPVKTYSTGMKMRLGFSIAINVEPEILIVDEALSVGDGYFQKKCLDRILRFVSSGRTLLFCSHAMYYVSTLCQRALWLHHGQVAALGPVKDVVREYENHLLAKSEGLAVDVPAPEVTAAGVAMAGKPRPSVTSARPAAAVGEETAKAARILSVRQLGDCGEAAKFRYREPWVVEIEWASTDPSLAFHAAVGVDRADGVQICSFGTHRDQLPPLAGRRRYKVRLLVPELPMLKGEFSLYVFLLDEEGLHVYDQALIRPGFEVEAPEYRIGLIDVEHSWDLDALETELAEPVAAEIVAAAD